LQETLRNFARDFSGTHRWRISLLEEFLHGTQNRLGIIDKVGVRGAETHVKVFMLRHQRLLGISAEDAKILQQILEI